jgi:hypothetical protein
VTTDDSSAQRETCAKKDAPERSGEPLVFHSQAAYSSSLRTL